MIPEATTRQLLVRSGGRCALCNDPLLTSRFTQEAVYLGERAHIVGRSTDPRSPRGGHDLPAELRDDLDNLMLACRSCHGEIDASPNLNAFTVERLRSLKQRHESRVAQIMAVPPERDTAVLRMHGTIGDSNVAIDRSAAADAVLAQERFARFLLSHDPTGIEIDLRQQSSPSIGHREYYDRCRLAIDDAIARRVTPAIEDGSIRHLSVFALARGPLLVYLGAWLGDKLEIDIYQRHRATASWAWPDEPAEHRFSVEVIAEGSPRSDAVLVLSMSAAVHAREVPQELEDCRIYRVRPDGDLSPHSDVVNSPAALRSAEIALRSVLADIEEHRKTAESFHVLGAAPLSVFITLGRVVNREIHPPLILHDRVDGQYLPVMEVK